MEELGKISNDRSGVNYLCLNNDKRLVGTEKEFTDTDLDWNADCGTN